MNYAGKLFLSGGGHAKDSFLLDCKFVSFLKNRKLLYIPIGLQRSFIGYEECYDWITKTISVHTNVRINIIMWIDLNNKTQDDLRQFDAIYIGGAQDSYKFMEILHKTKFIDILYNFLKDGKIIYGGSTGAIIMGKNISILGELPKGAYANNEGLNLVKDYSIYCHYTNDCDSKIIQYINRCKNSVIAIPENSGIFVENNKLKVVGYNNVIIFDAKYNKSIIKPASLYQL